MMTAKKLRKMKTADILAQMEVILNVLEGRQLSAREIVHAMSVLESFIDFLTKQLRARQGKA